MSDTPISPVGASKPELTISEAAINSEPAELDSTPTSAPPEQLRRRGSKALALENMSPEERQKRDQLLSERKTDPAVLVNIPQTPSAEEFGKSEDAEATVGDKTISS